MAAVCKCHEDIALRLIEAGATPHIQDRVSRESLARKSEDVFITRITVNISALDIF